MMEKLELIKLVGSTARANPEKVGAILPVDSFERYASGFGSRS